MAVVRLLQAGLYTYCHHSRLPLSGRRPIVVILFAAVVVVLFGLLQRPTTWNDGDDPETRRIRQRQQQRRGEAEVDGTRRTVTPSAAGVVTLMQEAVLSDEPEKQRILLRKAMNAMPTLEICNATALLDDVQHNKPVATTNPIMYVPNHPLKIGYGPYLTKCGSTSAKKMLKRVTDNNARTTLGNSTAEQEEVLDEYLFFTFVRHPMERALAGYFQMEVFIRMGYIPLNDMIDKYNLKWWNKTCLAEDWGEPLQRKYSCVGRSSPAMTTKEERKLQRLNDFLDDIIDKGFVDQHITPLTYLLATNPIYAKHNNNLHIFDLQQENEILQRILLASTVKSKPTTTTTKRLRKTKTKSERTKYMSRQDNMDWTIHWTDLIRWSANNNTADTSKLLLLAKRAIQKLCQLYKVDIQCLPYQVPECDK